MLTPPAPPGEPFVLLPMERNSVPQVTEWRSTWICSGLQTLRARGLFDRYVAALAPEMRSTLPLLVPGLWIPIAEARAHYDACGTLGLSPNDVRAMGSDVGERTQGTILRTAVAFAKGAGADGWTMMRQAPRIWHRGARGGAVAVYTTGPKESVVEVLGCSLFEAPYFRASFHGVLLAIVRLVSTRAYAKEKTTAPNVFVVQLQWA